MNDAGDEHKPMTKATVPVKVSIELDSPVTMVAVIDGSTGIQYTSNPGRSVYPAETALITAVQEAVLEFVRRKTGRG